MPKADHIRYLLPELNAFARSISRSSDRADDLVQDAVERAVRSGNAPSALDDFRPWMFRIIKNLSIDEHRKQKVRTEYSEGPGRFLLEQQQHALDPAGDAEVRDVFDRLSPDKREILFLIDVAGFKYAEAAIILDVPTGTIMSRVSRARRAMLETYRGLDAEAASVADFGEERERRGLGKTKRVS